MGSAASPKEMTTFCVTGSTGYVGSWLVQSLLKRGYHVRATARNTGKALQLFSSLDGNHRLSIFRAELNEEGSFDEALRGCVGLFHVAASMELDTAVEENIEEHVRSNILEPAVRGTTNVLQACVRAGTIRRVIFTSSISNMTAMDEKGQQKLLIDESCVRPVDEVWNTKPSGWIYVLSKRLAEEEAFKYAKEKGIDLLSIILPTIAGPFLTPYVPTSIQLLLSPITGDLKLYPVLVSVHSRFGSVPLAHIEDLCDAYILLMETAAAEGRYLCSVGSYSMPQLADLLSSEYPSFSTERLRKHFHASSPSVISSKRLTGLGFKFRYDVADIIKQSVTYSVNHGFLKHPDIIE